MKGEQIKTAEQLNKLLGKCVWSDLHQRHIPVAFIIGMPFYLVTRFIKMGKLYKYKIKCQK